MTEDEENFRKWFVDMLERLRNEGNAGFVFALVSFPLLERYLRQKSGAGQKTSLPEQFFCELGKLFPGIAKREKDFLAVLSERSFASSGVLKRKNQESKTH